MSSEQLPYPTATLEWAASGWSSGKNSTPDMGSR
jgi:hypothetical protein